MTDEAVGRREYEARHTEVERRVTAVESDIETHYHDLRELISAGFKGVHQRQDIANGRVAKVEATCAERGRTCPGLARAGGGIIVSPKLAVGIVVGVLVLAIAAVAGPSAVTAFLERAF
jgi:hypothetical protein